jgi:hypothetical protein
VAFRMNTGTAIKTIEEIRVNLRDIFNIDLEINGVTIDGLIYITCTYDELKLFQDADKSLVEVVKRLEDFYENLINDIK